MRSFIKKFIIILFINSFEAFGSFDESYIDFTAHNIGQGNCMTVHLYEKGEDEHSYILVDGGSNAYKKDIICQKYFKMESERQKLAQDTSQPRASIIGPIPLDFDAFKAQNLTSKEQKSVESDLVKKIRNSLGASADQDPISVKTVFISHPDTDHYNWISKIFYQKDDEIENIILGGLPESYSADFKKWLNIIIPRGSHVYFPSIQCEQPVKNSLDEILKASEAKKFADQMFSDPKGGWPKFLHLTDFKEALPWGEDIKTYLLTVNPTHSIRKGKVRRDNIDGDSNSDSLIVNFRIGNYSLIITGDATNVTTQRALENYEEYEDFFSTETILTADHHGSYTHGSNSESWMNMIQPTHVICSAGTTQYHPAIEAYERFKKSKKLQFLESRHDIWVYQKTEDLNTRKFFRKPFNHSTCSAIFSTFNSGDIKIRMLESSLPTIETAMINFSPATSSELKIVDKTRKELLLSDEITEPDVDEEELGKLKDLIDALPTTVEGIEEADLDFKVRRIEDQPYSRANLSSFLNYLKKKFPGKGLEKINEGLKAIEGAKQLKSTELSKLSNYKTYPDFKKAKEHESFLNNLWNNLQQAFSNEYKQYLSEI